MPVGFYQNGQAHFQHQDWLGTERIRTSYNGGVEGTYTSLPFGDALTTTSGTDLDSYHFAGLDHDYSSDTDHAQFRQYVNVAGRWMSPDPYSGSYDFTNPQSLNRYAYVLNSPLGFLDPIGLDWSICGDNWCVVNGNPSSSGPSGTSGDFWDVGGAGGVAGAGLPLIYIGGSHGGGGGMGGTSTAQQLIPLDPDQQRIQQLAQAVSGEAGWVGTWKGPAYFYGASFLGAFAVEAAPLGEAVDLAAIETESTTNVPLTQWAINAQTNYALGVRGVLSFAANVANVGYRAYSNYENGYPIWCVMCR